LPPATRSSLPSIRAAAHGPAVQPILQDNILPDIFLRLDGAVDIAALSAACSTFHHVVFGHRFLCHFRSIHPPLVLGFLMRHRIAGVDVFQLSHGSAPGQRSKGLRSGAV
jgi:hypothetical protein